MALKKISKEQLPSVGLALSGGGALGIAHIGVIKAFVENEIPIDLISGTSAGALVGAAYAFHVPIGDMEKAAKEMSWSFLASFPMSLLGLASNRAVEAGLEKYIGKKKIEEADIPLAIVVTDIEDGEKVVLRSGEAALAVRASCCIPGMFVPVEIGGRKFVDGGLTENLPLSPLKDMGADIKIGVNVIRWHSRKEVKNVIDVMTNSISILASHQRHLVPQNVDILIEPKLDDYSPSDFKKNVDLIKEGYRAAQAKIPEIKELIAKHSHAKKPKGIFARFMRWLQE
jgi:NTE family protein